jgi:TusA-related sulfurtransferase
MVIATPTVGKANVGLALTAQASGKSISIYLDSPTATCANFPSWAPAGSIRHIKLNN